MKNNKYIHITYYDVRRAHEFRKICYYHDSQFCGNTSQSTSYASCIRQRNISHTLSRGKFNDFSDAHHHHYHHRGRLFLLSIQSVVVLCGIVVPAPIFRTPKFLERILIQHFNHR